MSVQSNIEKSLSPLSRLEIVNGNLITVAVTTADKQVEHLLGRLPIGWIVVGKDANANVWQTAAFNDSYITLQASTTVNLTLWVF